MYFTDIPSDVAKRGITLELCAGIVDKEGKSLAEIATEEGRTSIRFYDFNYVLRYTNYSARINVVWGCHSLTLYLYFFFFKYFEMYIL